jgi:hypothetical protein
MLLFFCKDTKIYLISNAFIISINVKLICGRFLISSIPPAYYHLARIAPQKKELTPKNGG